VKGRGRRGGRWSINGRLSNKVGRFDERMLWRLVEIKGVAHVVGAGIPRFGIARVQAGQVKGVFCESKH